MDVASIPRMQSQRVALYEQQFGSFDSGKNAYWSLRRGRPVTLAEGARFDADMRAGRLAKAGTLRVVRGVSTMPSKTGAGVYRAVRDLAPMPAGPPLRARGTMGYWYNTQTGQRQSGQPGIPPSRMTGWKWVAMRGIMPVKMAIAPQERTSVMPTEARYVAALPATPPPGLARPPKEPLFEAVMRQFQEQWAAPVARPDFATPARPLTAAPRMAVAGFDMKKLALPLALVAGAFVVSKLV